MTTTTLVKTSCISVVFTFFSLICMAQPHANFSAFPLSGCAPLVVNFTDLSTGNPTSWRWTLGNSTTSFLQHPSVTYFNPGTYTVKLVVQNAQGADSVTFTNYITIYGKPTVDFSASSVTGCFPLTVDFSDLSTTAAGGVIDSWQWDFGDGQFSTAQNPSHVYTSAGSYNVSLRVRNGSGCYQTITRTQYINVSTAPNAGFTPSATSSCTAPINIYFFNTSSGTSPLTYFWNFGDGFTSVMPDPSHSYAAGTYSPFLVVTNANGCKDTFTVTQPLIIGDMQTSFTSPATVCVGTGFTIDNTSAPVSVSYSWDFGDGTNSTVRNPTKTYSAPGTYLIKLVNDFGNCSDSLTKMITVKSKPSIDFTAGITGSCRAPFTVHFTNATTGGTAYQWNFGDGGTSSALNPSHTYTATGLYTVTLVATGANGCSDSLVKSEYIHIEPPVAAINDLPQEGCAPFSWTFSSTNLTTEPVTAYLWNFGDGTTSTLANPTHVFSAGVYNIQLIITTQSGCRDTVIVNGGIKSGIQPDVNFDGTPRNICAETAVVFSDLTTGAVTDWLWDFGDGGSSTLQNPQYEYHDTGYFYVQLIALNNGCPDTIRIDSFIHVSPPIANFAMVANCNDPLRRTFNDRSIGANTYSWNFGDGQTSNIPSPVHVYAAQGLYLVTLTVTNILSGCSDTKTANVRIIDEHPVFSAADTVVCRGTPTTFTASVINIGNISAYQWIFGDGTGTGTGRVISHTYNTTGWFNVRLITIDINGCRDTILKPQYMRVNGPIANFGSTVQGSCLLSTVNFTDSSTTDSVNAIVKWVWSYGDGVTDTLYAPPFQHNYSATGIYTVKLTVTDAAGCSHVITRPGFLTISRPVANFTTLDTATCPNRDVTFINSSTGPGLTYSWDFGDGQTSSVMNPTHSYMANGSYSVKLVITDQYGCTDSLTKANYIGIITPQANFTLSDTLGTCPPLVVDFVNTSQNYTSINWDFGDGTSSQSPNPSHFYSIPGTYISKLTVTGQGGCTSVKEQIIVVRGPQGTFTYGALTGCRPLTVNFVATTRDRISFIWDFNDGSTLVTPDSIVSHTYTVPGEYVPKMILRDAGGCVVPIRGEDTIRIQGITSNFNFNAQPLCNSGIVQFTNTSVTSEQIANYAWDFGDGSTSTVENPSHLYTDPGTYFPSLVVHTIQGCSDSLRSLTPIKVVASPQAQVAQSANGCTPVTITFNSTLAVPDTSAISWSWTFGNGNTSLVNNPDPQQYNEAGAYDVFLYATNSSGCTDTVRTTIEAYAIPAVNAGADTLICQGRGINLNATGAVSYTWSPSAGLSCTDCPNPIATPPAVMTYHVLGVTEHGCSNTDSLNVAVKYPFTMTNSARDTMCAGSSVTLSASGAFRYEWSPSSGLSSTNSPVVVASPASTTNYQVIGTDDRNCFSDTGYIPVTVYNIPTVEVGPDRTINTGQQIDLVPAISADVIDAVWTPTGSGFRSQFPGITVKPKVTTTYSVTVTNLGGCTSSDLVTVYVICNGSNIFIPNTFSPNSDGTNDVFYPRGSGLFSIKTIKIFSRWGEVIFEKNNFQANNVNAGWDGTYKGKKVNPDVFVYVIEVICDNNSILTFKGNIALIK